MLFGNERIGVVGNGFVGGAVAHGFVRKGLDVFVYDKQPNRSLDSIEDVLSCDFIFVCLPTPMNSAEGGDADLSILIEFFEYINEIEAFDPIYILKSTVPVGTTEMLSSLNKEIKLVHNPEFLTAANAKEDFLNPERTVIGGPAELAQIVSNLFMDYFCTERNKVCEKPILMDSKASEIVKYSANSFLALKVSFFNMVFELSKKTGVNFDDVVNGVCSDSRIGYSHTLVPGPDGQMGYGGTCFPKDINAMIKMLERLNIDNDILKASWYYNKNMRKEWDWSSNPSAVTQ